MKTFKILCCLVALLFNLSAPAQGTIGTPFFMRNIDPLGAPLTGNVVFQAWPPIFTITIYGTNVVYGGRLITNTPDITGFFTNRLTPGSYRVYLSDFNTYVYANIPDTATYQSLTLYLTNAPNTQNPLGLYGVITNMLGFAPATNSHAGIIAAFQAVPATNTYSMLVASLGYAPLTNSFAALTNAIGYTPATNSPAGIIAAFQAIPATNTYAMLVASLGYTPLTNSFTALTNAIGYQPATNSFTGIVSAAGYQPATNSFSSITNLLVSSGGVPAMLGYIPATNLSTALIATLGFVPANITNVAGVLNAGPGLSIVTNGNQYGYSLWIYTNLATGVLPTITAPNGSTLDASNGASYHMTNNVWHLLQTF